MATATVTYHRICNKMSATSGAGTAYRSGPPAFTPNFKWGSCYFIGGHIDLPLSVRASVRPFVRPDIYTWFVRRSPPTLLELQL